MSGHLPSGASPASRCDGESEQVVAGSRGGGGHSSEQVSRCTMSAQQEALKREHGSSVQVEGKRPLLLSQGNEEQDQGTNRPESALP